MKPAVIFNYDSTEFFWSTPRGEVSGEALDRLVDRYAATGIDTFFCSTNGSRVNYGSDVWEPEWHGYDPAGPDDQPALLGLPAERIVATRRWLDNMKALHEQGVDYPARVLNRCRHHGISPWISLRMNDAHDVLIPDSPQLSTFWRNNPQLQRLPYRSLRWPDNVFDYAHDEVRLHYFALIRESLERYDIDGLELDFMRHPFYFAPGHELAGSPILTDWIGEIRELVRSTAATRGHKIRLGVRVPTHPETARNLGLDVVEWAKQQLVDLVTISPQWSTIDFNVPWWLWSRLLKPHGITIAAALEAHTQVHTGAPMEVVTLADAQGFAAAALEGGADCIYLFNFYASNSFAWTPDEFRAVVTKMRSPDALRQSERRILVTFRDTKPEGDVLQSLLPAIGPILYFRLQTGPRPEGAATVAVSFEKLGAEFTPPQLRVNGVLCGSTPEVAASESGTLRVRFAVPEAALTDDQTVLELTAIPVEDLKVVALALEMAAKAPTAPRESSWIKL